MTDATDALRVDDLSIAYGGAPPSVSGVSLRVRRGEIIGVIGESGSGKSSIALAMMGLLPDSARVTAASMEIAGAEMQGASERDWCRVRGVKASMVFQEPMSALNPCMRIGAQIAEVLRIHGKADRRQARARALEILELVQMPDAAQRLDYYPHQLSGGQRQRVVIAIAVAAGPSLLVADEPTTALDVRVQEQVLDLIEEQSRELGLGVLLITHDLGIVAGLAHRVAVMRRGRIVEDRDVDDVFAAPAHPYTRALLGSIPRIDADPDMRLATVEDVLSLEAEEAA